MQTHAPDEEQQMQEAVRQDQAPHTFEHVPQDPNHDHARVWAFWHYDSEDYVTVPRYLAADVHSARRIAEALHREFHKGFERGVACGKSLRSAEIMRLLQPSQ